MNGEEAAHRLRSERVTMITDFVLALVAGSLALPLLTASGGSPGTELWWGVTLLATAAGALCGGIFHGIRHSVSATVAESLWRVTLVLSALVGFSLIAVGAWMVPSGTARGALLLLAGAKLALVLLVSARAPSFTVIAVDSGVSLLMLGALAVRGLAVGAARGGHGWILAGVLLSLAGAALQQAGFRRQRTFDHNDMFHLVQAVACFLFYQGAGQG